MLGLLLVTWLVWVGGATTLVPYGRASAAGWIVLVCVAGVVVWRRARPRAPDPLRARLFWGAEAVFALAFAAMALLVAYAPDVWNTEKPMDMAFSNAVNRARTFPPEDPWLAGADLNYYYLGHLALALPVKLAALAPDRGYNVAVAALFGLTAAAVFTLGATLWAAIRGEEGARRAGAGAVLLVLVLGNLDGARELAAGGAYDWFAPARVVPDAITEFPWFSFILGDLHAHVLALPFTLLVLAFALQVVLGGPRRGRRGRSRARARGAVRRQRLVVSRHGGRARTGRARAPRGARLARGRPRASASWSCCRSTCASTRRPGGSGWSGTGRDSSTWRCGSARSRSSPASRSRAARGRSRPGLLAAGALAALGYAAAGLLAVLLAASLYAVFSAPAPQRAVWLLVAGGLACLLGPELLYVRDEFDGSPLYRMNTVFKLGYQAWLLLGLAGIGALAWRRPGRVFTAAAAAVVLAAAVYPIAGTYARTDGFARTPTLDGLGWLRERAPGDPGAIAWLNAHAPTGAVVLESTGEDYSPDGHARISTFTGLPTVLGWPGHELQWGHDARARAGRTSSGSTGSPTRRGAAAARAVRDPLRRRGTAGARRPRARGRGQVGRARPARVRPRGHDVWELSPGARTATRASRRSGSTARAA